ncbi:MAG: class 1 fructose-bisphosphatase [Candidatus Kerfeldbacteria bacterium]|nr:class 1 fructose-bisphosphatase [Candidatus Kerfeldbacteria bacterium]
MKLEHPTLSQFVLEQEAEHGGTGEFSNILLDLGVVGKTISREVNKAGLVGILGDAGLENTSGDQVKKLDVLANELFINYLSKTQHFCAIASEEETDIVPLPQSAQANYVIAFDPLDGSSNIDFNVSIGTIFSIHRRLSNIGPGTLADFLQPGHAQVAAGYILYGSSTMLVYSTGHGVHGFTLDPSIGEWLLSHHRITIPQQCQVYSANEAYAHTWDAVSQKFLEDFKRTTPQATSRHIGSLVADIHRNLLKGGLYFRPYDNASKRQAKLRLNYELKPLAFIVEQAGGYATDGQRNILDITPSQLHQKYPMIAGNAAIVQQYEQKYVVAARSLPTPSGYQ